MKQLIHTGGFDVRIQALVELRIEMARRGQPSGLAGIQVMLCERKSVPFRHSSTFPVGLGIEEPTAEDEFGLAVYDGVVRSCACLKSIACQHEAHRKVGRK